MASIDPRYAVFAAVELGVVALAIVGAGAALFSHLTPKRTWVVSVTTGLLAAPMAVVCTAAMPDFTLFFFVALLPQVQFVRGVSVFRLPGGPVALAALAFNTVFWALFTYSFLYLGAKLRRRTLSASARSLS
jgi:hypothetical protein